MREEQIIAEFKTNACYRMDESTRMLKKALEDIDDQTVWKRPNENSNSIGNLILHLCGNITQYAIASLGELPDTRERDKEFDARDGLNKGQLLQKLEEVVAMAKTTIANASIDALVSKRAVQGFHFSGIGIVMHVVEHYSYHTGQIAFWVKLLSDRQLGFYDGFDLNTKNNE